MFLLGWLGQTQVEHGCFNHLPPSFLAKGTPRFLDRGAIRMSFKSRARRMGHTHLGDQPRNPATALPWDRTWRCVWTGRTFFALNERALTMGWSARGLSRSCGRLRSKGEDPSKAQTLIGDPLSDTDVCGMPLSRVARRPAVTPRS